MEDWRGSMIDLSKLNDTELHCHTQGSNLRMRDCIIKPKALIDHAINMGKKAVAITDHASLSEHIQAIKYSKQISAEGKDIKVLLGSEIYLVDDAVDVKENYQSGVTKFYHFILIAKDKMGYDQLREINAVGWQSSFFTGKMRRVPNDKKQIEKIIGDNKGHLVASTACIGGELGNLFLNNQQDKAYEFIEWCIEWFGRDCFAIELQPSDDSEQIEFNKWAKFLADKYDVRSILTCDVHYLEKKHHDIHAAFLKSSEADRGETEDFYATTYMMNLDEKREYLNYFNQEEFEQIINNGWELVKDCQFIDMEHQTTIPERDLSQEQFQVQHIFKNWYEKYPYINKFAYSPYEQDAYFLYMVEEGFLAKKQEFNETNISRIAWELEQLWLISDKLEARMSAYYNLVDYIVDLCWEIGFVGISRGSITGYYTAFLIDMQQMNPIKWNLPAYRHLNAERVSWPDVDLDTSARNRPRIIQRLREVFGEENILNICTFKTETPKAALKTVCRGVGISSEEGDYLSSLVPVERGKQWSLSDCLFGSEEFDRKPVTELVNELNKLSDEYGINFQEYALLIEDLVSGLSLHASGIYIFKDGYLKQNSLMKTPRGDDVTCWSMEDSDYAGGLKYDSLTTECQDKLEVSIELLLKHNKIEWQGNLRETYNKYLHPDVLEYDDQDMWDKCSNGQIIDLFQFITPVGGQCIRKIQPHSLNELMNANSLMRITVDGDEQPVDKFLRYKKDRNLWYEELERYGVTIQHEIKALEEVLGYCYGVPSMQEDVMELCMRKEIAGFGLADADEARKIIAKKKRKDVQKLKDKFYKAVREQGNSQAVANYVWEECIKPQLAYSFSRNHVNPYSVEALQEMNLYCFYPHVYWNCAALIVNAGMADSEAEDGQTKNTQYGKIAKAIYRSRSFGVPILPPSINESEMTFTPIEENNSILFGLGGIAGINPEIAQQVISNRPYASFKDFYTKNSYKGSLIAPSKFRQLIKAGCFDEINPNRINVMKLYIKYSNKPVTSLTMANIPMVLKSKASVPKSLTAPHAFYKHCTSKSFFYGQHPTLKSKKLYWLDNKATRHFTANCQSSLQEGVDYFFENDMLVVVDKSLEKLLKPSLTALKEYINTPEFLEEYNKKLLLMKYNEFVPNQDIHRWEMETLSHYQDGKHELDKLDKERYLISDFGDLPEEPVFIEKSWGKKTWKQYALSQIAGVVLDRNDNSHLVTLLTSDNQVINIKFYAGLFANYKRQNSVVNEDGRSEVVDPSYFSRGQLLIVSGFRRGESDFMCKRYKNSIFQHSCQRIWSINEDGSAEIQSERYIEGDKNQ